MSDGDGDRLSEATKAKLREAQDRILAAYDLKLSDAEKRDLAERLADAARRGGIEIEAELHIRPVLTGKFTARIGPGVSNVRLLILTVAAIAVLVILFGGILVLATSSVGTQLWK